MSKITDLLAKYEELRKLEEEVKSRRANNEDVRKIDNELFVTMTTIKDEIKELRGVEAKKIWAGMDQERYTYEVITGEREVYHPYMDRTETYHSSRAYISVMGLKLLAGSMDTDGRIASVEELLATNNFYPMGSAKGLLQKFEVDPEGTKKAVAETLRVRFMKDGASMPLEIKKLDEEITAVKDKIEKLEKLVDEDVPDNIIMRKIFKKKFEAKERAPKEIASLKRQLLDLVSKKENCEYRLKMAETYKTEEDILKFIEEEYKYLVAVCERDYEKEVSQTSQAKVEELEAVEEKRKENKAREVSVYEIDHKRGTLEKSFNADFVALEELYGDKEFVAELKSIDISKLSEDEQKIISTLRDSYEQYLLKAVQKYED